MAMNERFKEMFSLLKIKESDAADVCNVSTRTISRLKHRDVTAIPVTVLANMHTEYKVNLNWLITGNGARFSDTNDTSVLNDPPSTYKKKSESKLEVHLEEENKWLRDKYDELLKIITKEGMDKEDQSQIRNSG